MIRENGNTLALAYYDYLNKVVTVVLYEFEEDDDLDIIDPIENRRRRRMLGEDDSRAPLHTFRGGVTFDNEFRSRRRPGNLPPLNFVLY